MFITDDQNLHLSLRLQAVTILKHFTAVVPLTQNQLTILEASMLDAIKRSENDKSIINQYGEIIS